MLVTIPAVIYISFVCWSYGSMLFHFLTRITRSPQLLTQPFSITCLAGLAVAGAVFSGVTLIAPVGDIVQHILLLFPILYWAFVKREAILSVYPRIRAALTSYSIALMSLLFAVILLVLAMHSATVNHPDTLAYHAQLIEWTKSYHAVPGIAHLNVNYGSQSVWFTLCALFSFSFTGTMALTFVNAAVLIWFVLFIVQRINAAVKTQDSVYKSLLWLLLLGVSLAAYTQVRLTANSASPDFIAALYVWLVFYLFIQTQKTVAFNALILFLSLFALTIKLSALPCVLPALFIWFGFNPARRITKLVLPLCMGLLIFIPYLAKNLISTGYLLYPSSFPDWFDVDWKVPTETVNVFQGYISTYARTHVDYDRGQIVAVLNMGLLDWVPVWWKLWSWPDKIMLACIPLFFVVSLFFPARVFSQKNRFLLAAMIFSFIGIVFWFIKAPDPRFGLGFTVPFCALAIYLLVSGNSYKYDLQIRRFLFFWIMVLCATTLSYTAYRFTRHMTAYDFIEPAGIAPVPIVPVDCNGVKIYVPLPGLDCGNSPVPCTTKDCRDFVPRGKDIQQGFKSTPFNPELIK